MRSRELQVVEAEQLHAFVEVEQPLRDIVQPKELFVTAVEIVERHAGVAQLLMKGFAQTRADVQQRQKSRRIESAAVAKSGANQVIVVRSNRLENVQQPDRRLEHLDRAANQPRGVAEIAVLRALRVRAPSSKAAPFISNSEL